MCPGKSPWFKLIVLALALVLIVPILGACGGGKKEGQLPTPSTTYEKLPEPQSTITGPVEEAWIVRYAGPAEQIDELADMAVDDMGNVYATGSVTITGSVLVDKIDDKTDVDYVTIKYGADGTQEWAKRYDGNRGSIDLAKALALDSEGNVLVTGTSGTVKYDGDGNLLWSAGTELAKGMDIVVDGSDYVYVTGDTGTVKYDSAGRELWNAGGGGRVIRLDSAGHVYVGCKQDSFNVVKYSSDGDMLWSRAPDVTENLTGTLDYWYGNVRGVVARAVGMAVDESGNVYLGGWLATDANVADFVTMKYDVNGTQQWVDYYLGPPGRSHLDMGGGQDWNEARAITVSRSGTVWVTGMSARGNLGGEYLSIGYDSDGKLGNVLRYDGPDECVADRAESITVDASGNVYVAGWGGSDFAVVKCDDGGSTVWVARSETTAYAAGTWVLEVDGSGNVYVAGSVPVGAYGYTNLLTDTFEHYYNNDFVIIKYTQ